MNSKLLSIMAIGLMTLFLSAQTFAWAGTGKDKDVGGKTGLDTPSCMCKSADRDMSNMNQGGKSRDLDRSATSPLDLYLPMTD
ncbi:MAG: hypothetical protein ABSF90_13845 [Syntrophobacteraceae bacterium]